MGGIYEDGSGKELPSVAAPLEPSQLEFCTKAAKQIFLRQKLMSIADIAEIIREEYQRESGVVSKRND